MADDPREDRAEVIINAFLQHRSMEQRQHYLLRGRRFAKFHVGRLNDEWIVTVKRWLARKDRSNEQIMDDLTAELRLRGLEPPYGAVKQELANRSAQIKNAEHEKAQRELAQQIGEFTPQSEGPLH